MNEGGSIEERLDAIENKLAELIERVTELESESVRESTSANQPEIREYVESADPNSHVERSLLIAAFLERHEGSDGFTTNEISEGYERVRQKQPANLSDVLARAEQQDYSMEINTDGRGKRWQLTGDGEQFVAELRDENG